MRFEIACSHTNNSNIYKCAEDRTYIYALKVGREKRKTKSGTYRDINSKKERSTSKNERDER